MKSRIYVYSVIAIAITAIIAISVVFSTVAERNIVCSPDHDSSGDVSLRIIGGEYAEPGEYPFHVSIQYRANRDHSCGGCLISDQHVLTTAQCSALGTNDYLVAVGASTLPGGDLYEIDKGTRHPDYSSSLGRADIGVIRLKKRVRLSENVTIIDLPHRKPDYIERYGRTLHFSGFGYPSKSTSYSRRLKKLTVSVCKCPYTVFFAGRICTSTIKDKAGACSYDRGSPAVIYADLTIVMGIISQYSLAKGCAEGYPDVFTDVQYYEDWIRLQLE